MSELVSVITPIYNSEKYISKTINSVINQSYKNLEIILVDDGSTDKTYEILKKYSKMDKRIKLFHQKNKGAPLARNKGLEKSTGRYIVFVDSDDILEKDAIEKYMENVPFDILIGNYRTIDENGKFINNVISLKNKE